MKTIYLIRHAKSSWDDALVKDFDRPLNERGLKDAGEMAQRLHHKLNQIDLYLTSPALRAKTTAEIFVKEYADAGHFAIIDGLYLAPANAFDSVIAAIDDQFSSAAIFAHNPGITDFANSLTKAVQTDNIPTCGIFAVKSSVNHWSEFAATQKTFLFYEYPKMWR